MLTSIIFSFHYTLHSQKTLHSLLSTGRYE